MQPSIKYKVIISWNKQTGIWILFLLLTTLPLQPRATITVYGAVNGTVTENDSRICFKNGRVEVGIPLRVEGATEDVVYQWVITDAADSKNSFTTMENFYIPTENDREKLITVTVGNQSASIYFSSLPVIYLSNQTGYSNIGEEYSEASMCLQGNEAYSDDSQYYTGIIQIKLRGNSTKWRDKRPFHIKLDSKADLLGLGENKNFALLANDIDHTLMRNKLLYDFSGAIGMETYEKSENVVVIFNNKYYGVYQLSELVDLGSDRVDIYDWEDTAGDAAKAIVDKLEKQGILSETKAEKAKDNLKKAMCLNLCWMSSPFTFTYDINQDGIDETYTITDYIDMPKATGGALLEMDFFAFDGKNASTFVSDYSQPLYFKSPENAITNDTFFHSIDQYIQSFEYALHSLDFIYHEGDVKYEAKNKSGGNENTGYVKSDFSAPEYDGKHYSELFDMDSLVQNFIVCEYSMNWDGMKNSVFMYKDINGLFYMGPEWDFDWAWGNINMFGTNTWYPTSWHTTEKAFTKEQYYQTVQWNRYLIRDPYFLVRAYEKYHEIRGTVIEDMIRDGGTIDADTAKLKDAAAANDAKWGYTYAKYKSVGFQTSVSNMKKFINTRVEWMDDQFASLDTFISSLGYYKQDDELEVFSVDTQSKRGVTIITAKTTNQDTASIEFLINGINHYNVQVSSGQAICEIPDSILVTDPEVSNVIQILAVNSGGEYLISSQETGNTSAAKSNYAVFYKTSQAESTAIRNTSLKYSIIITTVALLLAGVGAILILLLIKRRK
jgi:hypothetical protein